MTEPDQRAEQLREVLDGHTPLEGMDHSDRRLDHALASHLTIEAAWREHLYRCRYRTQLAEYRTSALQQLVNLVLDGGDETVRKACVDLIRAAQAELDQPLSTPDPLNPVGGEDDGEQTRSFLHWFLTVTDVDESAEGGER